MSEEELRDQINKIANRIMEVEEGAKKKETYVKSRIAEEFDSKISEVEVIIKTNQDKLNGVNNSVASLVSEQKKLNSLLNTLKKQHKNLEKEKKKSLDQKLKSISNEKNAKMKEINRQIKTLEKKLK
ncbi:MAG: hypothetical protein ACFFBH_05200 [Promethearchaeota archaeon]